jgi:hypothetical protein
MDATTDKCQVKGKGVVMISDVTAKVNTSLGHHDFVQLECLDCLLEIFAMMGYGRDHPADFDGLIVLSGHGARPRIMSDVVRLTWLDRLAAIATFATSRRYCFGLL